MESIDESLTDGFARDGFSVAPARFAPDEVAALRGHYMELRAAGTYPGDFDGVDLAAADPLKRYPRMIHMHRWDDHSLRFLFDQRLRRYLTAFMGAEPYGVQTMLYFKPAGARGQALHQDNFYLRVQPGTCIAAWLALDDCNAENGCMRVVPGSHRLPILCTTRADTKQSFTDVTVPVPPELPIEPILMAAGDVLFFHGSLIHGSYPNESADRFRRALIAHYVSGDAETIGGFYNPAYRFDGSTLKFPVSPGGGRCGVWVADEEGASTVAMTSTATQAEIHE
jgi:phytanoyl-CoA hydroxylase